MTAMLPSAIVLLGSSIPMVSTGRRVSDWLWAKPFGLTVVLLMGSLQATYCQEKYETPQQTNDKIQQLATLARARPVDTPIGSGDLLHIDVFDVPELSRDVRVSDTGDISYPLVPGKIPVAGTTSFQVESKLEQLLIENGLVSHPQVSVFVKEQNSTPVTVVGAVNHTIVYQVVRPTTLLEILTAAGGIADTAGSVVIVMRPARSTAAKVEPTSATPDPAPEQQKITIRLQDLLESGDSVYNIQIYGGDTITVPPAGIVYVLGFGVTQPGGYVLQSHGEQITVLKALGPRQTGRYGMVLPTFVQQALEGTPITVFGTGQQSRCYCDVRDTIRAILLLIANDSAVGEVVNIGSTEEISMEGLANVVKQRTESESPITYIPYDQAYEPGFEDMPRRVPSLDKLARLTAFRPATPLWEIVDRVRAHLQEKANEKLVPVGSRASSLAASKS